MGLDARVGGGSSAGVIGWAFNIIGNVGNVRSMGLCMIGQPLRASPGVGSRSRVPVGLQLVMRRNTAVVGLGLTDKCEDDLVRGRAIRRKTEGSLSE